MKHLSFVVSKTLNVQNRRDELWAWIILFLSFIQVCWKTILENALQWNKYQIFLLQYLPQKLLLSFILLFYLLFFLYHWSGKPEALFAIYNNDNNL